MSSNKPKIDASAANQPAKDTLFYDGSCPICRHEMHRLQRGADAQLNLVDIHSQPMDAQQRERLCSQLHMQTADGTWLTGLEANVRAWQHTRFASLASLLLSRPIRPLAEAGYRLWLRFYHWQRQRRVQRSCP